MSVQAGMSKYQQFEVGISIATPILPIRAFVDVGSNMRRVKPPVLTVRSIPFQSTGLEPTPNSALVQAEILRRLLGRQRGRACQKCLNNGHHFTFAAELGEAVRCSF